MQVWGRFEESVRPYKGIPGGLISEDTHRPSDADFAGGYLLQSIGVMPLTYAGQVARGRGLWGEELRSHMRGYNHTAGINILGDCLPHDENELVLSEETDARGLPKPLTRLEPAGWARARKRPSSIPTAAALTFPTLAFATIRCFQARSPRIQP
jgi:hypothetical protein